jgi:hypothetical protein
LEGPAQAGPSFFNGAYASGVSAALIVNPQASRVTPELTLAVERELAVGGRSRPS